MQNYYLLCSEPTPWFTTCDSHLQQDALGLGKAAHVKVLQVSPSIRDHKHHVQLVGREVVDRVVLRLVQVVPGMPLAAQRLPTSQRSSFIFIIIHHQTPASDPKVFQDIVIHHH